MPTTPTKPQSKIISIITVDPDHKLMALCQDGSIWWLALDGTFTLVVEMTGSKYV